MLPGGEEGGSCVVGYIFAPFRSVRLLGLYIDHTAAVSRSADGIIQNGVLLCWDSVGACVWHAMIPV